MRSIARHWQRWWHGWWSARQPATDTLALTHRNVYILPTRAGLALAATLAVLLVASINFQLNLGYGLTFLLAGSALAGMHVAHGTLRGLRLAVAPPGPAFAGAPATLAVTLANDRAADRHAIAVAVIEPGQERRWAWCDVPGRGQCSVQVALRAPRRGRHPLPVLTAQTRFPLGTFRAWTLWRPAATLLVYPAPEHAPPPLPPADPAPGASAAAPLAAGDEFDGLRPWRAGDSLRRIAWKKVARSGDLVSRDSLPSRRHALWLDLAQAGGGDLERRLSRLCAWVLQADRLGIDYGLRLPGACLAPARGEVHRQRCLEALALC